MKPTGIIAVVTVVGCGACSLFFEESVQGEHDANTQLIDAAIPIDAADPIELDARVGECGDTLLTFEDVPLNAPGLLLYGGVDFRVGLVPGWRVYQAGEYTLESAAMALDSDRPAGTFQFVFDGVLRGLRIDWAETDITLTIDDQVNEAITVVLDKNTPNTYVTTHWEQNSGLITITSSEGFRFFIDDICHTAL